MLIKCPQCHTIYRIEDEGIIGLKDDLLKENTLIPERRILAPNTSVDFDIVVEAPTQTVKRIHAFFMPS